MRVLYLNDELATSDGSNYHALGVWNSLKASLGEENVRACPAPADGSGRHINHKALGLREHFKFPLQLVRLVRKTLLSLRRARQLCKRLEAENFYPTHIVSRAVLFDITSLLAAKHFHAKLISEFNAPMYYEHGTLGGLPLQKAMERWERKVLLRSDLIYTVSEVCRDMLCAHYGISAKKCITLPNGYMSSLFSQDSSQKEALRRKIRQTEGFETKFVITFVGSLKKWHGIDNLCRLADTLQAKETYHFLVIGDGAEQEQILNYCKTHQNMTYKGKLPLTEMAEYLYASDLGIMPYHKMEHFYFSPLKLFDMVGAGLPFIGTAQGQIAQIGRESLNPDFLLEDNEPANMAEKIEAITSKPAVYQAMQAAVLQCREKMSWEARTAALLDAAEKL